MKITHRIVRGTLLTAFAVCLSLKIGMALAQAPGDEKEFTAIVADRVAHALPDAQVAVKEPLLLAIKHPTAGEISLSLGRIWSFCTRNLNECKAATSDYVDKTVAAIKQVNNSIDTSTIQIVLRPSAYIEGIQKQMVGHPEAQPVMDSFSGEIWWSLVIDDPQTVRLLGQRDLEQLKLTKDQAFELAKANLRSSLRPLPKTKKLPKNGIGTLKGSFYESSRLLLHEDWAGLARAMSGSLIVAAPDPAIILYSDSSQPNAVQALSALAKEFARKSEKPLSMTVLRWSESGWIPIAP